MRRGFRAFAPPLFAAAVILGTLVPGETSPSGGVVDPALLRRAALEPESVADALVSFGGRATLADTARLRISGFTPVRVFDEIGIVYGWGPARVLPALAGLSGVRLVSANRTLEYDGATDTVASRAREAWDAKSTSIATQMKVGGNVVNGAGIGVAIIDSGINGLHPDLDPAVVANKKFVCATPGLVDGSNGLCFVNAVADVVLADGAVRGCTNQLWVDADDTDTTGGHGTHVAGIVAGRGTASDGRITGAAPGASLVGLGIGEVASIFSAVEALTWVSCNHDLVTPKIRVVNNSWGARGTHNPNDPINKAVNVLVGKGITVVFSAGNRGGDGKADEVNTYGKSPTKGVICVANYDDQGTATRTGGLEESSSRGKSDDSNKDNWPDVSAPGTGIDSTAANTGAYVPPATTPLYEPYYTSATGTSMAAPHVAGIVALLLQAKPTLTPAAIEDILEDRAVQVLSAGAYVTDPTNTTTATNHAAGHGLVDAIAALRDSRVGATGGSPLPQVTQTPYVGVEGSPIVTQPLFGAMWTVRRGLPVDIEERFIRSGNTAAFPLADGQAAAFKIFSPSGSVLATVTTTLKPEFDPTEFYAAVTYTFAAAGAHRVETQINFVSGLRSTVSFVIRAIG